MKLPGNKLSRSQGNYRMKLPSLRIYHSSMDWKDHMKKYTGERRRRRGKQDETRPHLA
jgi:hypothetical protein